MATDDLKLKYEYFFVTQALKFENYHDSALARLLLERSITSVRLAQQLYWLVVFIICIHSQEVMVSCAPKV